MFFVSSSVILYSVFVAYCILEFLTKTVGKIHNGEGPTRRDLYSVDRNDLSSIAVGLIVNCNFDLCS